MSFENLYYVTGVMRTTIKFVVKSENPIRAVEAVKIYLKERIERTDVMIVGTERYPVELVDVEVDKNNQTFNELRTEAIDSAEIF